MIVVEYKIKAHQYQYDAIDEAIHTCQFIRNKALRLWMDGKAKTWCDLNKYSAVLAKEFDFVSKLNSQARQASAERAWFGISRFFDNYKKKVPGKIGRLKLKGSRDLYFYNQSDIKTI